MQRIPNTFFERIVMSGEDNSSPFDSGEMMRQWFQMASQAAETCQNWAANQAAAETMRQTRSNIFQMWGDYWEKFFRSATFLNAEKQSMAGNLEFRKKMQEFLGQFHHEMQLATAPDIDQLMRALRRMGEDQQEQYEQLCQRLDEIELQLDDLAERLGVEENNTQAQEYGSSPEQNSNSSPRTRRRPNSRNRSVQRRQQ
jgi:hypothetical protein